ncbi:MAG: hypothetical protein EHM33_11925 [Chloroflexi bacterium]|nr:MAG: hypothetical protein EHM33_11925 [Chloroflexota bacterium]
MAEAGMKSVASCVYSKLSLRDAVHISKDMDCRDPAFAPGSGPPAGYLAAFAREKQRW